MIRTVYPSRNISKLSTRALLISIALIALNISNVYAAGVRFAKPAAVGAGDCSSWDNACTLQTALTGAVSGNEIWVMSGTYKPTTGTSRTATFQLKSGVAVYGGFDGAESTREERDPAVHITILSGDVDNNDSQTPSITNLATVTGNTTNSYHVVKGATGATLDGFTITAGAALLTTYPDDRGGGLLCSNSSPALANLTIIGNISDYYGGGMFSENSTATLTDIEFTGNSSYSGGGLVNLLSAHILTRVTFSHNSATTYNGGGMYSGGANPTLTDVIFTGNTAESSGGGMYNTAGGNPSLSNVTFDGNSADTFGGGMFTDAGSPWLSKVTFSGNSASAGGGLASDNSSPKIRNSTFTANLATGSSGGGGLYFSGGTTWLTNVTIANNTAITHGGGIYNSYTSAFPWIRNAIIWGNAAPQGAQIYNINSSAPVLSNSVVQGGCPTGSTCSIIFSGDPMLGTLGDYGGFTQTIPLLEGSWAIDTGDNAVCSASTGSPNYGAGGVDQRGILRPQGAVCDIGAYEVENTPPTVELSNAIVTLPEDADTTSAIKVADIVVTDTDNGVGINFLSLSGAEADLFEIIGDELYLKAGATLDFEINPTLEVIVEVEDSSIGSTPDDSSTLTISVSDVNEAPLVALSNTTTTLAENVDTASAIRVADITILDDALGINVLSLSGLDADLFEVSGSELRLKADAVLDYETNPILDVTVAVNDAGVGGSPDDSESLSITVSYVDENAPSVQSITRNGSETTSDASVDFTVTFSESVTGVDETDFVLTTSGITGALVTGVSGSGSSYIVTVSTGSGNGTLRLDVTDNDTIQDSSGNHLGGSGTGNGDFTSGEAYAISKTFNVFLPMVTRS